MFHLVTGLVKYITHATEIAETSVNPFSLSQHCDASTGTKQCTDRRIMSYS